MSINDKRRLIINFSTPYFSTTQKLMVKKDSKINHLQYFNNNGKLAIVMGTTGEKILHLVSPNAHVVGTKTYKEAVDFLEAGWVDGVLGDDCILAGYMKKDKFRIINKAYSREYYGVATRKNEYSKELLNQINSTIALILDENRLNLGKKSLLKD